MPFGERLISSRANNSFTRRDNAEAIFSKVDKVGSLRSRSIDLMCRKDKPDFSVIVPVSIFVRDAANESLSQKIFDSYP